MALDSYIFNAAAGETPETVARRRQVADALAARIFGRAPQNVGEGIASIGQALIARSMASEADDAQKAGLSSANAAYSSLFPSAAPGAPVPIAPPPAAVAPPVPDPSPVAPPPVAASPGVAASASPTFEDRWPVQTPPAPSVSTPMGKTAATIDPTLTAAISGAAANNGVDPAYMTRLAMVESGGDPNAASSLSSARGPFQFIKSTAQQYGLTNPSDPAASADAAARLTLDNKVALTQALGREPTMGELYLAHQQGAGGAAKLLANPNAPVESVIGADAARNNGAVPGMTAGQFASKWTNKFSDIGQPQTVGGDQPSPLDVAQYPAGPVGAPAAGSAPAAAVAAPATSGLTVQQLAQIASNPWLNKGQQGVVGALLKQQMQSSDPMRRLQMVKLQADIDKATGKSGVTEYGLNPIYGIDEKGNQVLGTIGKDGTFKKIDTGGVKIQSGVEKIDLGTHYQLRDKRTGQVIGVEPKDIRGAAAQKEEGTAQGKATVAAPMDIQAGNNALDTIKKIREHPYIDRGTGITSFGNSIPGTGGYDFQNLVNQSKSGAFLQAIQQMRGLGSLSNAEGMAATAAVNRMNTATSKDAFLDAVTDYEKIVKQGISRAQSRLPSSQSSPVSGGWQDVGGVKIRRKQ